MSPSITQAKPDTIRFGRRSSVDRFNGVYPMHEMSIVLNIIDIADKEAQEQGAAEIHAINVEIGTLAGVEISSLEFCYRAARKGTVAERAELVIDEIQGRGFCSHCNREFPVDFFVSICPDCGEAVTEIRKGRELRVRSIKIA